MSSLRLLLADDHEMVRQGLRAVLARNQRWEIVGEARTGREAVDLACRLRPDVVIVDISMPELNGLEATRRIRRAVPQAEVLILTAHESEQLVREVLAAGARGYVLKNDAGRLLVEAVEALARHLPFFTPQVSEQILKQALTHSRDPSATADSTDTGPLTSREREIVQLVAEGQSTKELAHALGISVKTAETHRTNIMRKLNIRSVSGLVRYAIRNHIIDP